MILKALKQASNLPKTTNQLFLMMKTNYSRYVTFYQQECHKPTFDLSYRLNLD